MIPFNTLDAIAAPLPVTNVDTDKILPGQFLKTITREGLGSKLFWALRQNPDFVLNRPPWNKAKILVTLDNFGCGSSREHAPWALLDFGIRCILATGFADIFYSNCFKNGILPVVLNQDEIERLLKLSASPGTARITVDLFQQTVVSADGQTIHFGIEAGRKIALLEGIDDVDRTLAREPEIDAFEARYYADHDWVNRIGNAN